MAQNQFKASFPTELREIIDKYLESYPEYQNPTRLMHFAVMRFIRERKPELFEELKASVEKNEEVKRPLPDWDWKPLIKMIEEYK